MHHQDRDTVVKNCEGEIFVVVVVVVVIFLNEQAYG
jgi:hypothetical protein